MNMNCRRRFLLLSVALNGIISVCCIIFIIMNVGCKKNENLPDCRCEAIHDLSSQVSVAEQMEEVISFLNQTTKENLVQHHPNFPMKLVMDMRNNKRCNLMPSLFNIRWQNIYWQEAKLSEDTVFFLYSAIYDNRTFTDMRPCVRVLGVSSSTSLPDAYCHFWFNITGPPVPSKVIKTEYIDYQWMDKSRDMTYMLTCRIPSGANSMKPVAVSLVHTPCQIASNLLHVTGAGKRESSAISSNITPQYQKWNEHVYTAAVCGPALYYYHQDFSIRMVEWLESLRAQGISQVFLYETDIHPNLQKVLRYYEKDRFIQVTKYSYPPPYINEPSIRRLWTLVERKKMWAQENVYFTDCLLRHMHQYRFIAHYDPDELPVLLQHRSYTDMLNEILRKSYIKNARQPIGYKLQWNMFYYDVEPPASTRGLPEFLYMLRHILRTKTDLLPTSAGMYKAVYDMDYTTGVSSHVVITCNSGPCSSDLQEVSPDVAYLAHYTLGTCGEKCKNQDYMREEPAILKNVDVVKAAVKNVLETIGIL
nr:uncharacterized protein LOC123766416 isoform X1 [Procambarus clarkii]XP_045611462.1 uncharacterized protein LOC123766416 isoform X1 [Procambarus clarkii]XP_045611463.1 uncharacterized protein LOC123766416 isoform X1 [Procambarus clarkii]XP_045611464.1 uncharacterized protein LOC123766416 isoform X1 [Procambarus clarkii]